MEKINIAELLRNCPQGMELDCTMYNNVTLLSVDDGKDILFPIRVLRKDGCTIALTKYGQYADADFAKCVIFPKGKTTWEGFHRPFEPGDIVITNNHKHAFIYSGENDRFWECFCGVYCGTRNICINSKQWSDKQHKTRLATEEEKEKLFKAIKDNGYHWNEETKTLEKLVGPKFKVGDRIRNKKTLYIFIITNIDEDSYYCGLNTFWICDQDEYELVPNKFDITTLKPFDKVLVRLDNSNQWYATWFSHIDEKLESFCRRYVTISGKSYTQMIPYEGNEHLCGTKDDCDDFYKIWE